MESIFKLNKIKAITRIQKMQFVNLKFERGLGVIEDRFILIFSNQDDKIHLEIAVNIRIRDEKTIFLTFNDLYLNQKRQQISVRKYRSQVNIEKTYLSTTLEYVNQKLSNQTVKNIVMKEYGDIYITFTNNVVLEIFNDTHLENAMIYRIIEHVDSKMKEYEVECKKCNLTINY